IAGTPGDVIPWVPGNAGSMFGVSGRYLQRAVDYRSTLGEIIREHLGATQNQLNRIIPAYITEPELGTQLTANNSSVDGTPSLGEVDVVGDSADSCDREVVSSVWSPGAPCALECRCWRDDSSMDAPPAKAKAGTPGQARHFSAAARMVAKCGGCSSRA